MRSRNIKPSFWSNEYLAQLPYEGRLLFIGLWNIADREGRLEDRPLRIKAQLFPFDVISGDEVDALLNNVASFKENDGSQQFITRYEVEGAKYIEIKNFVEHQRPHIKEQPSTYPAPVLPGKVSGKTRKRQGKPGKVSGLHAPLPPSPLLESPISESPTPFDRFPEFWKAYPRKQAKADAEKAWGQVAPDDATVDAMLVALKWQTELKDWTKDNGQFIPLPATYLRGKRWLDEKPKSSDIAVPSQTNPEEFF